MATADEYAAWIVKNQSLKGTPDFDTVSKAYLEAKQAEVQGGVPGPRRPPSTLDVATSAPYKAITGAIDLFINTPQNIANLAKMAYGTAVTAAGYPALAPEVTAPRQRVTEIYQKAGLIKPTEGMTTGQRILDVGLQAATGGVISPAASVRELTASAAKGLAAGTAGQTTAELTGSPVAGMAVSMATPAAITSAAQARQARLQAEQARNAVRDLTIRAGQAEGYVVTPGSITPSAQNVLLERLGGKTRTQQEAASRNQQVTDRLSRRALNLPDNAPLTRENMRQIREQEYQRGYAPINNIGIVRADQDFDSALNNVLAAYTGPGRSFPNAIPQPVQDLVASYRVGQFNAADAVGATRALRESSRTNLARGDNELGLAQRAISNALEDQIERSLQTAGNANAQAMLDQFRASRQRMAISHSVEDAILEAGGSVNAAKLANDLQTRGRYFSGDLETIARFANVARPVMVPPGTMGTPGAGTMVAGTGIGGGLGALYGGPGGASAGAMIGMMAPGAVSYGARNYLLSPMGQRRALPTYDRPINSLMATEPLNNALLSTLVAAPVAAQRP
jgi:parvulin-like peptidyl-prolyl isomerase